MKLKEKNTIVFKNFFLFKGETLQNQECKDQEWTNPLLLSLSLTNF